MSKSEISDWTGGTCGKLGCRSHEGVIAVESENHGTIYLCSSCRSDNQ